MITNRPKKRSYYFYNSRMNAGIIVDGARRSTQQYMMTAFVSRMSEPLKQR